MRRYTITAAGTKTYHAKDALYCRACNDSYGPAVEKITRGFCADCYREIQFGQISPPKTTLVADPRGFSPDLMNRGTYHW